VVLNSLRLLSGRQIGDTLPGRVLAGLIDALRSPGAWVARMRPGAALAVIRRHGRAICRWGTALAVAAYLLSGVYIIKPDEVGVVRRFGTFIGGDVEPGLHYHMPWPVEKVVRLRVDRLRTVEIGYRLAPRPRGAFEPPAYEWGLQHRSGRYVGPPLGQEEEGYQVTADAQLVTMNVAVQYQIVNSQAFLFRVTDPEQLVRVAAEAAVRAVAVSHELTGILTDHRSSVQDEIADVLKKRLGKYGCGVRLVGVWLQDVHPPIPVVDAFRDVSSALEERTRMINQAEGYANERAALAVGDAARLRSEADGYSSRVAIRAEGDAYSFRERAAAYGDARTVTGLRLLLEALEAGLAGRKKLVLDGDAGARQRLFFMGDGQSALGVGADGLESPPGTGAGDGYGLPAAAFGEYTDDEWVED